MDIFRAQDKIAKEALRARTVGNTAHATSDGYDNFVSRLGLNNDNALSAGTYEFNLITRNRVMLEAAYRGSWVVGKIVDAPAEDMTCEGVEVTTNEDKKADLKDLKSAQSRLQIWQSLCLLIKWGRLYGGALGILQIRGQNLATPLDLETIGLGQFQGITVFDRWALQPSLQEFILDGPEMGLPLYYTIVTAPTPDGQTGATQIRVHHSRVIRYTGIDLPYWQAITENMWGESILERLWDRLIAFDNVTMSSASLVDRANLRTVQIDGLRQIIAAGKEAMEGLLSHFEMMRSMQVNEGLTLLDKNDEFASTAYTFSGLSDMMLQFCQQLSGAADIPLVRLFCQPPTGLAANGDSDMRMYYKNVNAWQEAKLRNPIEVLLKILWRSVYGRPAPKDMEFTFKPLWQMDASDKATVAKSNTETVLGVFEAGVTDRATTLKELRQSSGDTGLFSNITDEQVKEAEDEPPPQPDAAPIEGEGEKPADPEKPKAAVKDGIRKMVRAWVSRL